MWIVAGVLCLGVEMAQAGGFVFVFFGLAALVVGGTTGAGVTGEFWQQAVLLVALSAVGLVLFRHRLLARMSPAKPAMDTLVGEVATVQELIEVGQSGKVELRGTTWTGHNPGPAPLTVGQRCRVMRVEGLTVWLGALEGKP